MVRNGTARSIFRRQSASSRVSNEQMYPAARRCTGISSAGIVLISQKMRADGSVRRPPVHPISKRHGHTSSTDRAVSCGVYGSSHLSGRAYVEH
uniref:Uncharacterized protein n=1 Tax=Hyaloperonospora arabidopsidis (strain Emoy2) TaxID=559515 RepID=M4BKM8_HYAAE